MSCEFPGKQDAHSEQCWEARVHISRRGNRLPYRLLSPLNCARRRRYPLVFFFHGAGERGDDNTAQVTVGVRFFASAQVRERYPCFVVAPQCPPEQRWVDAPWEGDTHTMPRRPAEPMRLSLELVRALMQELNIDSRRVYVTGLSMGGFAAWDVIARYPDRFAAAAPVCGGGDEKTAKRIAAIPIWAFHGAEDTVVPPQRSRNMIDAVRRAGGRPRYSEYLEVAHDSWDYAYRDLAFYEWLFSHRRKPT